MRRSLVWRTICLAVAVVSMAIPLSADGSENPPNEAPRPAASDDGFPLPLGAIHRFGSRKMRHPDGIVASAISPDGKYLATASRAAVVVWNLKTLKAQRMIVGARLNAYYGSDRDRHLAFLSDSTALLVTVGPMEFLEGGPPRWAATVAARVWDIETGKVRFELPAAWDYYNACWPTADGKEIAVCANGADHASIHYFDARDGKALRTVKAAPLVGSPWVARGGRALACPLAGEKGLSVIDPSQGNEIYVLPRVEVVHAAFSLDGNLLVCADTAGKILVHDLKAKKEVAAFDHPEPREPGPMVLSSDNETLYFSSDHGRLFRWDLKTNKQLPDFADRHNFWNLSCLALSADEKTLYSMSEDRLIKRWDVKTGKELPHPEGYTTRTTLATAADGKHLIVSDREGQIDFWDISTGRRAKQIQPSHISGINCLARSADGRWLAAGRSFSDGLRLAAGRAWPDVRLFDLTTGKVIRDIYLGGDEKHEYSELVRRVAFSPDAKVVFIASIHIGVSAWDVASGKKLWQTKAGDELFAVDPAGRWIAVDGGRKEGPVTWTILDPATGQVRFRTEVEFEVVERKKVVIGIDFRPYITDLEASPDGLRVITAHFDGTVRTWATDSGKELSRLNRGAAVEWAHITVSPDGKWLGASGPNNIVTVWDLAMGKQVQALVGNVTQSNQIVFTRDGRGLITSADLAPLLWDLAPNDLPPVDGPADVLWNTFIGDDAAKAYRLQWALIRKPAVAVRFLADRIKVTDWEFDRPTFDKTLANLDSPRFAVREAAERALMVAGSKHPRDWLKNALADTKSEEVRTRLDRVLTARAKQPDPAAREVSRAVQVLELAGTAETSALLKTWAKATGGSVLADEATAALKRLSR